MAYKYTQPNYAQIRADAIAAREKRLAAREERRKAREARLNKTAPKEDEHITLEKLDPNELSGLMIGDSSSTGENLQADIRERGENTAFSFAAVTRIVAKANIIPNNPEDTEEGAPILDTNKKRLMMYYRLHRCTAGGRLIEVSPEISVDITDVITEVTQSYYSQSPIKVAEKSGLEITEVTDEEGNTYNQLDFKGRKDETEDAELSVVHTIKWMDKDGEEQTAYALLDADIDLTHLGIGGVESVNEETGAITILGGENIEVTTDTGTGKIRISYKEGKEPDPDPEEEDDPCDHPQGGNEGVSAGDDNDDDGSGSAGGIIISSGDGGVVANGDVHEGDNDCNCN